MNELDNFLFLGCQFSANTWIFVNVKVKKSKVLGRSQTKLAESRKFRKNIKALLKNANKDHSMHRISKHLIFKFSDDIIKKALEDVEKDPGVESCSEVTKLELATYKLMKKYDFDEDYIPWHNSTNDTECSEIENLFF